MILTCDYLHQGNYATFSQLMLHPECSPKTLSYLKVTLFCSALAATGPVWFNASEKSRLNELKMVSYVLINETISSNETLRQPNRRLHNKSFQTRWRRTTSHRRLDDIQNPVDGEIGMLWLPYVVFTVVLLTLIFLSFMKFHCQRGDQYRRRRAELEDKPILNDIKESSKEGNSMTHLKKGFHSAKYSTIAKTVPDHLSLFLKFSQLDENHSGTNSQSWLQRRHSSDDQVFAHATKNHSSFFRSAPYNTQFRRHKSSSSEAPAISTDIKSHNVAYTFNINGSMVDVRCSNGERSNTFRINRDLTAQTLLTRDGLESALASSSSAGSRKQDSSRRKRTNGKGKVVVDFKTNPFLINSDESKLKCPNKKITLVKMVDVATSPGLFFKSKTNKANNVYCVQIP